MSDINIANGNRKRNLPPTTAGESVDPTAKRPRSTSLVKDLSDILDKIRQAPSSGEIPTELLTLLHSVMVDIDSLPDDKDDKEARAIKEESDVCVETWIQELIAQCDTTDGELILKPKESSEDSDGEDDEEETIALALALQDEEGYCKDPEKEKEQVRTKKDEDEDIEVDIL